MSAITKERHHKGAIVIPEASASHESAAKSAPRRTPVSRLLIWVLFAGIVLVALSRFLFLDPPAPPGSPLQNLELGQVPPFSLTDPEGLAFGSEELRGTPYVANFFFTSCPSICPLLMNAMSSLQERYGAQGIAGVRLVSFTVDPATDTPERLKEYASAQGVDARRWTLLTGEREPIRKLLVEGFRVSMGEPVSVGMNLIDIAHSGKFVLVGPQGKIRGFYNYDEEGRDALFQHSLSVLEEKP